MQEKESVIDYYVNEVINFMLVNKKYFPIVQTIEPYLNEKALSCELRFNVGIRTVIYNFINNDFYSYLKKIKNDENSKVIEKLIIESIILKVSTSYIYNIVEIKPIIKKYLEEKEISLIKVMADSKHEVLDHFRNGGTAKEWEDKTGEKFCNPL